MKKTEREIVEDAMADGELSILALGNSFSQDGMDKIAPIAKDLGIEKVKMSILNIGGCTLKEHKYNLMDNRSVYERREWSDENDCWIKTPNISAKETIQSYDWDYIVIQQASGFSGEIDTYNDLPSILYHIEEDSKNATIVWHMTWAYQSDFTHEYFDKYGNNQMQMYSSIVKAVEEKILTNESIKMVIPTGTTIQNARTSSLGDSLTRDGCHLSYDKGRYMAALTFVAKLAGKDVSSLSYLCDGVDENTRSIAIDSVKKALANPYTVSTVDEEPVEGVEKTEAEIVKDALSDGELSILAIGNSFSHDAMGHISPIAKDLGVEKVKMSILYIGGCTLETHEKNLRNNLPAYSYREWNDETNAWDKTPEYTASKALKSYDWDYVVLQQASNDSGVLDTYNVLPSLISLVKEDSGDATLVWQMTWAYQSDSTHPGFTNYNKDQMQMYSSIVKAVEEKILTNESIKMVIPAGTTIQNARTSSLGDSLTRDGHHLSYDKGRYMAALTFVAKLAGKDVSSLSYLCDGVDESTRSIAIESVKKALEKPYEVSTVNL